MAIFSYLLILLSAQAVWVNYRRTLPRTKAHVAALVWCAGLVVSVAIISLFHYALLLATGYLSHLLVIASDGLLSTLLVWYIYSHRPPRMMSLLFSDLQSVWKYDGVASSGGQKVLVGLMFLAGVATLWWMWIMPRMQWDIWITWEQHARFIIREEGRYWRQLFEAARPGDGWFRHTDYPFLWPLAISRAWIYAGSESVWSVWGLIVIFLTSALYGVAAIAREFGQNTRAPLVGGLLLLSQPVYFYWATSRYAEGPLATYMLVACAFLLLAKYEKEASSRRLFICLSALAAGCAAWTKNEGMMFLLPYAAATAMCRFSKKELLLVFCWISAFAAAVFVHKTYVAPPGDLTFSAMIQNAHQLLDPARYYLIAQYVLKHVAITLLGVISIILIYRGRPIFNKKIGILYLVIALQFGGYMLTYLLTPHTLSWHLPTSFERIWIQLWPIVSLTIALSLAQDEALGESMRK